MLCRVVLLLFALAGMLVAAPVPKEFRKPRPKIEGYWKMATYEVNGRELKGASLLNNVWNIEGETLTVTRPPLENGRIEGVKNTIRIRADSKSREFDYVLPNSTTRLGRFEFQGETLIIALPLTNPDQRLNDTESGQGRIRYTFKRVDPAK